MKTISLFAIACALNITLGASTTTSFKLSSYTPQKLDTKDTIQLPLLQEYVRQQDVQSFKKLLNEHPALANEKDKLNRSMLYFVVQKKLIQFIEELENQKTPSSAINAQALEFITTGNILKDPFFEILRDKNAEFVPPTLPLEKNFLTKMVIARDELFDLQETKNPLSQQKNFALLTLFKQELEKAPVAIKTQALVDAAGVNNNMAHLLLEAGAHPDIPACVATKKYSFNYQLFPELAQESKDTLLSYRQLLEKLSAHQWAQDACAALKNHKKQ